MSRRLRALVFSKTAGFRHPSTPKGIAAIQALGSANGFTVVATEDANQFTTANPARGIADPYAATRSPPGEPNLDEQPPDR